MAFYSYKQVRNRLMEAGYITKSGEPVDQEKYGEGLDPGYDGNLHSMAADYIKELEKTVEILGENLVHMENYCDDLQSQLM